MLLNQNIIPFKRINPVFMISVIIAPHFLVIEKRTLMMNKVEASKDICPIATKPTFANLKKTWYVDASYHESDPYLYWQQSIFSFIDKSQQNHASSSSHSNEEFGKGIIPLDQCKTKPCRIHHFDDSNATFPIDNNAHGQRLLQELPNPPILPSMLAFTMLHHLKIL